MVVAANDTDFRPDIDQIWSWLEQVPDPEIPVLSVVDLGIVRKISWHDGALQVDITPTYSGCPAVSVIALDIQTALLKKGVEKVRVNSVLSPVWTTRWISDAGRKKLLNYGIAPPVEATTCSGMIGMSGAARVAVTCPRCKSSETERVSQFGSTPCKASYQCKTCLEPFDYFKAF